MKVAVLLLAGAHVASAQSRLYGSIDGVPIPDHVMNPRTRPVCEILRLHIPYAARRAQVIRLGISVTDEELERERRAMKFEPEDVWKGFNDFRLSRAEAVKRLDKGEEPAAVYRGTFQSTGIRESMWAETMRRERTPEGRARLAADLKVTREAYLKGLPAFDLRPALAMRKLPIEVDRLLSEADPKFKNSLAPFSSHIPGSPVPPDKMEQNRYIEKARADWWRSRIAAMNVSLSDPTLKSRCALSTLGVR